jgi:signal transduction histidine kinase
VIREIGNPIAAIDGYARALLEAQKAQPGPAPQPEDDGSGVKPILQETARLIAITREINRLAAAPAAQWQLASLNEVVTQGLALLRYEPRLEDVKVQTTLDPMLPAVNCCADRLVQLLLNLVINAADATAGLPAHTARLEISTREADGGIELRVDDNGSGMPEEVRQRAFDPLFTTKPAGKGTGLGLPLCRAIAEEHGGRIRLEPLPQGGTRATLWLPAEAAGR